MLQCRYLVLLADDQTQLEQAYGVLHAAGLPARWKAGSAYLGKAFRLHVSILDVEQPGRGDYGLGLQ
ncbi:MAG: hypothetical protein FJW20_07390 [Acidimicrobiia bacterium]|nr:hypothetical protein [Acidimicrobiia bacterium]